MSSIFDVSSKIINLAVVLSSYVESGVMYIVMDYCDGGLCFSCYVIGLNCH